MPRTSTPERRAQLLSALADHLLSEGLSGLSLRPLARALGTSPRMLLYHFGSKESMVAEGLAEARRRQMEAMASWIGEHQGDQRGLLAYMWGWLSDPQTEPFLRLFFEAYALALQEPNR